jgi:hypothetical protein
MREVADEPLDLVPQNIDHPHAQVAELIQRTLDVVLEQVGAAVVADHPFRGESQARLRGPPRTTSRPQRVPHGARAAAALPPSQPPADLAPAPGVRPERDAGAAASLAGRYAERCEPPTPAYRAHFRRRAANRSSQAPGLCSSGRSRPESGAGQAVRPPPPGRIDRGDRDLRSSLQDVTDSRGGHGAPVQA